MNNDTGSIIFYLSVFATIFLCVAANFGWIKGLLAAAVAILVFGIISDYWHDKKINPWSLCALCFAIGITWFT